MVCPDLCLAGCSHLEWSGLGYFVHYYWSFVGESDLRRKRDQRRLRPGLQGRHNRRRADVAAAGRTRAGLFAGDWGRAHRAGAARHLGVPRLMNTLPILTILTVLPLVAGLVLIGLGSEQRRLARG